MVGNPGRPENLDGVEDKVPGGIRCKETIQSRPGGGIKTLWCFCNIQCCSRKDDKRATMEERESNNSGANSAHKKNYRLAGGVLGQYCFDGHTNCSKRGTARRVRGYSGDLSGHCCKTASINQAFFQAVQCLEKYSDAGSQRQKISQRDDYMHTL